MIALLLRRRVGAFYAGGQVVSDLSCAAFLLAYVNPAIRDDIGVLVIPLVLFVLYWETMRFFENRQAAAMRDDEDSWIDTSLRVYGTVWTWGFVLPAILSGAFLMFDLMAPNEWPFPNPKAPLACTPQKLRFGDELTLDIAPVLLGSGERLFDGLETFGFEPAEALHSPLSTHIRYRRVSSTRR